MNTLRPNDERARYAITMIWIVMILELFSILSGYLQYELLMAVADGRPLNMEEAESNDLREQTVSILYLIAFILSGIAFLNWFRRAYYNLHQKVNHLQFAENNAVWAWFIPFVNLGRPYMIMKELFTETRILLTRHGVSFKDSVTSSTLSSWWVLWIVNGVAGQIVFRLARNAETIDEMLFLTLSSLVSNLLGIPLAILAIVILKNYSKLETLLIAMPEEPAEVDPSEESTPA